MNLLEGKRALITGGTRGIGYGVAKRFLEEGASVALVGTKVAAGEEAVRELSACGKVAFYCADVSKSQDVENLVSAVTAEYGRIDILVNNAGIVRDKLLMRMEEEDWDAVLGTNLKSVYLLSRLVVRPMMKERFGRIINMSSVVGLIGNAGQANYAASKAGMIGFTKALAKEVATRGITVNCIAPGFIETSMTGELTEVQRGTLLGQIPMQRFGSAEEVADLALFLASSLSNYITGQVIAVDGGMVM